MNKVYDDLDKGLRECTQCKVDCYVRENNVSHKKKHKI